MSDLQQVTEAALRSLGLNGLMNDDGCACTVDDLMPCDQPSPHCEACLLHMVKAGECKEEDCDWFSEEHYHQTKPKEAHHD